MMCSAIVDHERQFGGDDSKDNSTKDDIEDNAFNSDGVDEQPRKVPNLHQQINEGYSEQSESVLQTRQTNNETQNNDSPVTSTLPDGSTDVQYTNKAYQSDNDEDVPKSNSDCDKTQVVQQPESTYFGSPKKLSNIVKEISSTLCEVKSTQISKSIETGDTFGTSRGDTLDGTSEHPTQRSSEVLSTSTINSNGLPVSDDVAQTNKAHPRGILKNTKSEPVIVISEPVEKLKHADSTGVIESSRPTWPRHGKRKLFNVSTSANYFRTTQEFVNPAFELDENIPTDSKLSDIVELVMKQQSDQQRYVHPFGQSNLYASMFLDDTPTAIQNTERVVFWLIFVIMLVGLAGAIILMAEMYRLEMLETKTLNSTITSS